MRVSAVENDPGFVTNSHMWLAACDNELIPFVITADEEKGMITYYQRGLDGKPVIGNENVYSRKGVVIVGVNPDYVFGQDKLLTQLELREKFWKAGRSGYQAVLVQEGVRTGPSDSRFESLFNKS